jgi:hypothetical protein
VCADAKATDFMDAISSQWSDSEPLGAVYAISDPRFPEDIRYVGMTMNHIRQRLHEHFAAAYRNPHHRFYQWLLELESERIMPLVFVLEKCTKSALPKREEAWIDYYLPTGLLLNRAMGRGTRGLKAVVSEKNREITRARNRLPKSPETIAKIRLANSKPYSPERLKKWRESDACQKMREATIARNKLPKSPETIAKLKASRKPFSPEKLKRWRESDAYKVWVEKTVARNKAGAGKPRPSNIIKVVGDDGRSFDSILAATIALKVSRFAFIDCMKNGWNCKGTHWKTITKDDLCQTQ